jgi:hypothetical protein
MLLIDAYSKWLEVAKVKTANSTNTIEKLRSMFATHGLPDTVVSDNGTVFTSEEMETFLKENGIQHVRTAPYHPASNGQVERAVQIFKEAIKRSRSGPLETKLSRFLFHYRTTVHSTTRHTPAEMLMGRRLRTLLDRMHPDLTIEKEKKEDAQEKGKRKERKLTVNELVYVQDLPYKTWIAGKVIEVKGNKLYIVEVEDGRVLRRHIDHIRHREGDGNDVSGEKLEEFDIRTRGIVET